MPILCLGADESAETQSIRKELETLKQSEKDIQRSLQIIKDILMGRGSPLENTFIRIAGSPVLGDERAKLVLVEFSDYQCPFCGDFARQTFSRLTDEYVKNG